MAETRTTYTYPADGILLTRLQQWNAAPSASATPGSAANPTALEKSNHIKIKKDDPAFIIDYQNTNDPVLYWFDLNVGNGKIRNADLLIRVVSGKKTQYIHRSPISSPEELWDEIKRLLEEEE